MKNKKVVKVYQTKVFDAKGNQIKMGSIRYNNSVYMMDDIDKFFADLEANREERKEEVTEQIDG